ncbi:MAG: HTH domain-containing protein [Bacteroidia bacterium]
MTATKYFSRLKTIDQLIQEEDTGRPKELAEKLNMSERMIYRYIQNLKDLGAPLEYDAQKESYIYTSKVSLRVEIAYETRRRNRRK